MSNTDTQRDTQTHTDTYTHKHTHRHIDTYTHRHTHTHMHTHTRTHTHMHTHTPPAGGGSFVYRDLQGKEFFRRVVYICFSYFRGGGGKDHF